MAKSKRKNNGTKTESQRGDIDSSNKKSTTVKQQPSLLAKFPQLIAKHGLKVEQVEPNQIYLIPHFFNAKECESLIQYFDTHLTPQTVSLYPKPGEAFRSNDRQSMQDPILANKIWELGLDKLCAQEEGINQVSLPRQPCGLNSNLRIYRYRPGQRFEAHYDDTVKDTATGYWTDWTLLIYLNDTMEGGETVFYKDHGKKKKKMSDPVVIRPQQGLALLHRHGQHCLLHEALEVTRGNKWVLRSDVLIG
ncbi:uncharacterized protein BX664DRAFT_321636 [Halteromyces radiatus]|uniref:uncharacterized protein n=1 Tax=Halteromyces radiatus TaxID=101107 RepID=UPI00221ED83E|nr:uncharacterized protein BX664DRAFT_321636 [Halteromyces radiatus]KAI8099575.1 hypothetical protein BX664DRAFT_321636 [Halteromyces radiatus]